MFTTISCAYGIRDILCDMQFLDPARTIAQLAIPESGKVADFGAGAGYVAVALADRVGKDGVVYVVDIQRELLTKVTHLAKKNTQIFLSMCTQTSNNPEQLVLLTVLLMLSLFRISSFRSPKTCGVRRSSACAQKRRLATRC